MSSVANIVSPLQDCRHIFVGIRSTTIQSLVLQPALKKKCFVQSSRWCVGSRCRVADSIRQGYLCPCLLYSDPTHHIQPGDKCCLETWQTWRKWDLLSPLDCGPASIQIQEAWKCVGRVCVCGCEIPSVSQSFFTHTCFFADTPQTNLAFFFFAKCFYDVNPRVHPCVRPLLSNRIVSNNQSSGISVDTTFVQIHSSFNS